MEKWPDISPATWCGAGEGKPDLSRCMGREWSDSDPDASMGRVGQLHTGRMGGGGVGRVALIQMCG